MKFIEFDVQKCDSCFKCLRVCPTKAISFTKQSRTIIDDLCIKCGLCHMQCENGALTIRLDINSVRSLVKSGKKVVASIAPSFAGAFKYNHPYQMATALKKLGFYAVEETARGAEIVSLAYEKVISEGKHPNLITSCCPSSNTLIEHYYTDAIDQVIPVVSPMIAHGYDLKIRYGEKTHTVFIGPCLAKKAEAISYTGSIDSVITFHELEKWFAEEKIDLFELESQPFDTPSTKRGKAYPLGGSLWKKDLNSRINPDYKYIHVDGIEACTSFLKSVATGEISGFCAELNICPHSCINGPDMPEQAPQLYKRLSKLNDYVNIVTLDSNTPDEIEPTLLSEKQLKHIFVAKNSRKQVVNDDFVYEVLIEMGKYTKQDQLNCGACGYATCYDKAVAVSNGYSDINMCMDTLRKKAESMQSIIFDTSPNAICILDSELRILEVNPAFHRLFNATKIKLTHWPIAALIDDGILDEIKQPDVLHLSKTMTVESINRTFIANVIKIFDGKNFVGIFTDITDSEKNRQELERVKLETLTTCQEVIDHQMRVAQEIASLLGETTAETKIGLNKLKKLVLSEGGNIR